MPASPPTGGTSHRGLLVVAICFLTIIFDGYDLIVYGSVVPSLLDESAWDLGAAEAGSIGSYALAGAARPLPLPRPGSGWAASSPARSPSPSSTRRVAAASSTTR